MEAETVPRARFGSSAATRRGAVDGARWSAAEYDYAAALEVSGALGLSRTAATVLVRRGLDTPAAARGFLDGDELGDHRLLGGMSAACDSILEAISAGRRIVVHGDYDCDGVCATALTVEALRSLGADVRWFVPSRFEHGYGIASSTIEQFAELGFGLVVSVDCGVTAVDQARLASELGMELVVLDHHRPGPELPDCPIVHPAIGDYPFAALCGTAVAYKVAQGLHVAAGEDGAWLEEQLDLVALATVADVVELVGENRVLVRRGLGVLSARRRLGLKALLDVARVSPDGLDARALGFALAPRINAVGRLGRADPAVELMLADDPVGARRLACRLDEANQERKEEESRVMAEAVEARDSLPDSSRDAAALVVAGEGWNRGVVGIVAGRLARTFFRPTVVISVEAGMGVGSARSIPTYDIHSGLGACAEHLRRFGGHRQAAGLELEVESILPFRTALAEHAGSVLDPEDLMPTEVVDAVVGVGELDFALAEELERFEPCGHGNPVPLLLAQAARLERVEPMGESRAHARVTLTAEGASARGVVFGRGRELVRREGEVCDVAVSHGLNRWNGAVEPRPIVRHVFKIGDESDGRGLCRRWREDASRGRIGGERWWSMVNSAFRGEIEGEPRAQAGDRMIGDVTLQRDVIDHGGSIRPGTLGDLVSTGDGVLVVVGDVSRRLTLVEGPAAAAWSRRREGPGALCSRCLAGVGEEMDREIPLVVDFEVLEGAPELTGSRAHLVILDPPPTRSHAARLAEERSADADGPERFFLHLAFGPRELEWARSAARFELGLREPAEDVYRAVRGLESERRPSLASLALALVGRGAHPLSPVVVGRSLGVLAELGLVSLADANRGPSEGVGLAPAQERTSLENSSLYRALHVEAGERLAWIDELESASAEEG